MYPVIGLPPVSVGAVQVRSADFVAAVAVTPVGADGALPAVGVTAFDWADSGPDPFALDACTVNV